MQTIRKFKQNLVGALALAIPLAVSAAPVTLRFAGEMQAAWPGAPVGTPFVVSYTFDPAQPVDQTPDPSEGLYVGPGGSFFFGTVSFTAGSLVLPGYLQSIYIMDNAPGQDDVFQIYAVIADAANNGSTAWIFASGKDWLSGDSLPLNAAFFDGASSLVFEAVENSPGPNPLQAFPGPAGVRALPEPGSLALVGLALAAVAGSRRGRART